jgi:hypothetical protein
MYKYRTFFMHNSQHNQPSTHRSTIKTMSNGESHPTPLSSKAIKAVNLATGLMKQPLRQHKNGAMAHSSCSSARCAWEEGPM